MSFEYDIFLKMSRLRHLRQVVSGLLVGGLWLICSTLQAQQPAAPPPQDTQKLKIETALLIENFRKGDREIQKLSGNVRLRQEDILVYCDTAIMDRDDAILKGNVVIEQGDSVKIFSDSTHYHADTKIADLFGDVVLENGKQRLFTRRRHHRSQHHLDSGRCPSDALLERARLHIPARTRIHGPAKRAGQHRVHARLLRGFARRAR